MIPGSFKSKYFSSLIRHLVLKCSTTPLLKLSVVARIGNFQTTKSVIFTMIAHSKDFIWLGIKRKGIERISPGATPTGTTLRELGSSILNTCASDDSFSSKLIVTSIIWFRGFRKSIDWLLSLFRGAEMCLGSKGLGGSPRPWTT